MTCWVVTAVSEYTPTTDEVRVAWAGWTNAFGRGLGIGKDEFDRWLSQLLAEAWDEGYSTGLDYMSQWLDGDEDEPENPYREEN